MKTEEKNLEEIQKLKTLLEETLNAMEKLSAYVGQQEMLQTVNMIAQRRIPFEYMLSDCQEVLETKEGAQ